MTQYKNLNVKLSNLQPNKFKSGIKNCTSVTLNLSSNLIGNSNNEINILDKLLLTNIQLLTLCKDFATNSSVNLKLSNIHFLK